MESEALLPAAMACTTDAGPETTSPPANTPGREVSRVIGSTWMVPPLVVLSPWGSSERSAAWPMARMTVSASMVLVFVSS